MCLAADAAAACSSPVDICRHSWSRLPIQQETLSACSQDLADFEIITGVITGCTGEKGIGDQVIVIPIHAGSAEITGRDFRHHAVVLVHDPGDHLLHPQFFAGQDDCRGRDFLIHLLHFLMILRLLLLLLLVALINDGFTSSRHTLRPEGHHLNGMVSLLTRSSGTEQQNNNSDSDDLEVGEDH